MNPIEKTRRTLIQKGKKIIPLSSGNPAELSLVFPQKILKKGFRKFLENPSYRPDPKGDLVARKAIAEFYSQRNFKIDKENILLTSGTSESYFEIFKLLAKPGDEILFPNPSYPLFSEIARLAEISLSFYRLSEEDGWQIDLKDLERKITTKTKAIVLISPNNPTGAVLSRNTLEEVLKIAEANNLAIISDEVFSEFIFDGKKFPQVATMAAKKNISVFTLNGISKTYALPGLKLSWILVTGENAPQIIDELERCTDTFLACNQITQTMLPAILQEGKPFLEKYQKTIESNRDLAVKILGNQPKIIFHKPEGGFYLFAKIDLENTLTDEELVIECMKKTGIFVHPGYFYDYEKGVYILISYVMPAVKLKAYLQKLLHFIKNL